MTPVLPLQEAAETSHVFEWIASVLMTILVAIVTALFTRTGRVEREMSDFITTIRTALLGIEGSGGMIHKVDDLMAFMQGQEAREKALRHEVRNEWQPAFSEFQQELRNEIGRLRDRRTQRPRTRRRK